jgi:SAM-dependent methyltransferase
MSVPEPLERRLAPRTWGEESDRTGPREVCEGSDLWGPRHTYRESLMIRVLRPRLHGKRLLNAGCGAGSLTMRLLDKGFDVTSLDASEPSIDDLSARVGELYPDRDLPVMVGDVCELPFSDREFDGAVCGEVLEHLDDDRAAVGEIARVLRPGGLLVATVPANPWRYDWADHWAGHRRRYTREGFEELVTGAGLERVEVIPWGFPVSGLYHRMVYERMVRRRLESPLPRKLAQGGGSTRWLSRIARAALELDTLFLGRFPGYFGLLAVAYRPEGEAKSQAGR